MDALITIRNFRSIERVNLSIREGLNVVVGANGSGKTNILHALRFMANLVTNGASLAMAKAGGPSRNFRRGRNVIHFGVETPLDVTLFKGKKALHIFRWDVEVGQVGADKFVKVRKERFSIQAIVDDEPVDVVSFNVSRGVSANPKTEMFVASEGDTTKRLLGSSIWVRSSSSKREALQTISVALHSLVGEVKKKPHDASLLEHFSRIHPEARRFFRDLISLEEFNIVPDSARQAVDPMPVAKMASDGSGVSEVIAALESDQLYRLQDRFGYRSGSPYFDYTYDLYWPGRSKKNPLKEIIENLKSAVSSIDSVSTEIDPSTGRRFVTFDCGGVRFRPQEISDGTFKWLCLLVALFVPTSRVLIMEEPENFMHPWMQQRFVSLANAQTRQSSGSIILSTHSVTVLNALSVDQLQVVYQMDGKTHIEPIDNGGELEELLSRSSFGLGDMWVSGEFGGVTGGH